MQSQKIPINKIRQNDLNPNEMSFERFTKLKENIRLTDQYPSLVVLKQEEDYLLLDGHNRLEALKELGKNEAWCEIWELDKKKADLVLATLNRLRGVDDVNKRAKLIEQLTKEFEDDLGDLYGFLPESESVIDSLLKIAEGESNEDVEKNILKENLSQVMDEDSVERIMNSYEPKKSNDLMLVFKFVNREDYNHATFFFGSINPDTSKLLKLIDGK